MSLARFVAEWSKDRSRKFGAVIVDDREVLVSLGWNGFPRGIDDNVEERHHRPVKYQWTEHAERNAIYNAVAKGNSTLGCRMYLPWFACADCARAIIQSGIDDFIGVEPDWNDPKYGPDFKVTKQLFQEAGVMVHFMPGESPVQKPIGDPYREPVKPEYLLEAAMQIARHKVDIHASPAETPPGALEPRSFLDSLKGKIPDPPINLFLEERALSKEIFEIQDKYQRDYRGRFAKKS